MACCVRFATVFLVFFAATAWAQNDAGSSPAVRSGPTLEEVVVTARRREESLQETPVAVSAMGEQALTEAGVSSITDLQQTVPGLQFGESGSKTPAIFIRAIGQREGSAVLDPGVGVYLNGIFIARQDAQLLDTVDTQSIQVLRGPQGTLFGKNNTGGAMLVTTKEPHFEQFEMAISGKVAEEGRQDMRISGNIPLLEDTLGMRFALNTKKKAGYLENVTGGSPFGDEERLAATARFLWDVNETLSADVFLYWSKQDELSTSLSCLHQNPESNISSLVYPGFDDGFISACNESERLAEDYKVAVNNETSRVRMTSGIYALTLNWGLELFDIKSITGISQQYDIVRNDDQDGTRINIVNNGSEEARKTLVNDGKKPFDEERFQISQELQISGNAFDGRLTYTTGLFLSLEKIEGNPFVQRIGPNALAGIPSAVICAGGSAGTPFAAACAAADAAAQSSGEDQVFPLATLLGGVSDLTNESWAVFAQGTYNLTDHLQLTVGGRHTVETRERDFSSLTVDHDRYQPRLRAATGNPSTTYLSDDAGFYSAIPKSQLVAAGANLPDLAVTVTESVDVREEEWRRFTPTVTLSALAPDDLLDRWQLDSGMVYATWSKGFKAGGFEPKGTELTPFDPEDVVNMEVGLKLDAVDSRLRFNAAIYQMDYTNIHVRVAEQGDSISEIFLFLDNAGEAKISGIEMETTWLVGNWFFFTSANYTDAIYDSFDGQVVDPVAGTTTTVDRSAEDFALVPRKSFALAVQYNGVTDYGAIIPRLSAYYRSGLFTGIDEKAVEYESSFLPSQTIWNGRLTWMPGELTRFTLFVNNLTDEQYFKSGFAVSAALGAATLVQAQGRHFGLEFSHEF